jgi:hypothetical protein
VQDTYRLLVCLFTVIMREMTELSFQGCRFMQSRMPLGVGTVRLHTEALKGVSLEWGEEGEREDGTGSEDSTGDGQWRSEFKQDLQSHQRRYDMQAQGAPESLGRSLRGGEDIMPWRPSPHSNLRTLSVEKLHANLAEDLVRLNTHCTSPAVLRVF